MKDETLLPDFDAWSRRCEIQLLLCNREFREVAEFTWDAACRASLQSGNSAQPVTVPDESWRIEAEKQAEIYGQSFVVFRNGEQPQCADPTKVVISFTDKGLGHNTVPEDRLQKAIVDACMVFLHGCDSLSKNYECDFSDSETELYFCIADVAKKIGVVEETGNRRWSLSQQMKEEINGVYRKYAMRIMEAAPKVTP